MSGDFWTTDEWSEWSNELAELVPEDQGVANPEAAQEHIVLEWFKHLTSEHARFKAALEVIDQYEMRATALVARCGLIPVEYFEQVKAVAAAAFGEDIPPEPDAIEVDPAELVVASDCRCHYTRHSRTVSSRVVIKRRDAADCPHHGSAG